ncbi:serine/threonine-protein kinase [Nocardioides sp. Bht2]|uniref:serine/threonine-protein kinase n=1 Tax=Nocardioides sp. Bht2 TaxID=3392297 RepID=UPI0039B617D3
MSDRAERWGFTEGDLITEELTAIKLLGGGAAYEAYLAFDEITYSPVVVKVVRPDQVQSRSTLRGLRREVAALAEINHPVVVRGLRHELAGERPHVVLEQVDGPRLSTLVRRYGPLQAAQYLPLAIDIAAALHYLRHVGYVHLDIKPSNVIMGAPARLIDLSVARRTEDAADLRHLIGTDAYMAPEQCEPGEIHVPGPASDVWGLGATLYHAVTGSPPFAEGDPDAERATDRFPQLAAAAPELPDEVPAAVAKVIHACLAPEPGARPEPADVAGALEPVLARLPRGHLAGFRLGR